MLRRCFGWILCLLLLAGSVRAGLAVEEEQNRFEQSPGWFLPTLGAGKGDWDLSVGAFLWTDEVKARNLQLRSDLDLGPGLRWHSIIRSNRELDTLSGFDPHFDENYLEGYGFYRMPSGTFSASVRVGTVRYLRFPYPDAIAMFDQVPGVNDLLDRDATGYSGELLTLDYTHNSGLGAHFTGINWGFGREGGTDVIEAYGFLRRDLGADWHFEARGGRLMLRPEPLGGGAEGFNVYLGKQWTKWSVGLLYEKLQDQPAYTGIMVEFPSSRITRALGKVAFDIDRNPEGVSFQIPLLSGSVGIHGKAPENGTLVGEIKARRVRTYWQNGQVRNYYEHRISTWGETRGKGLVVVAVEEPWYLQAEALVSPHTDFGSWDDLKEWEEDRQGPAQLLQKVTYQFYRVEK